MRKNETCLPMAPVLEEGHVCGKPDQVVVQVIV